MLHFSVARSTSLVTWSLGGYKREAWGTWGLAHAQIRASDHFLGGGEAKYTTLGLLLPRNLLEFQSTVGVWHILS